MDEVGFRGVLSPNFFSQVTATKNQEAVGGNCIEPKHENPSGWQGGGVYETSCCWFLLQKGYNLAQPFLKKGTEVGGLHCCSAGFSRDVRVSVCERTKLESLI